MPYPNEHAARLHDPRRYTKVRRENGKFGKGIDAVWGITKDEKVELQAIRFDRKTFTTKQARDWLKKHKYSPMMFEPATEKEPTMNVTSFETIICNLGGGLIRNETLEGKSYTVVPMVMMVEGVMNGSDGPLLYRGEDMAKAAPVWNQKPIVVYHPTMNGRGVSACSPEIINSRKIGVIMNARFESGALKADAFLDMARAKEVDERIVKNVEAGTMTEVSTGLFADHEEKIGEWKGRHYKAITRNHRPDHLAVLPDQTGACSIKDGAGLLRNALSFGEIRQELEALLFAGTTPMTEMGGSTKDYLQRWIRSVYPKEVVYVEERKSSSTLFSRPYEVKDGKVTLTGVAEEVEEVHEFRKKSGSVVGNVASGNDSVLVGSSEEPTVNQEKENEDMKKEQMVQALIENAGFAEEDRAILSAMSDEKLSVIHGKMIANTTKTEVPAVVPTPTEPAKVETPKTPTLNEYIAGAPAEIREVLVQGVKTLEARKTDLVNTIIANKANKFTKEFLGTMAVEQLEGIAAIAAIPVTTTQPVPMFVGQGGVQTAPTTNTEHTETPLASPTYDFKAKAPEAK